MVISRLRRDRIQLRLRSLALGLGVLTPSLALAQGPSLLQQLRELLGIQRPLAVAGSRSPTLSQGICVISPWPTGSVAAVTTAATPSGTPPIATSVPLAEVQILRNDTLVARLQASSREPLQTPLAWPGDPIPPGGRVDLVLRPLRSTDELRIQVHRPGSDGPNPELRQAAALEQLLSSALGADASQRRQLDALISGSCKPSP